MKVLTTIDIDFNALHTPRMIRVKQNDQGTRYIKVALYSSPNVFDIPEGTKGIIRVFKPDNTSLFYDVDEKGNPAIIFEDNEVTILLAEQALTAYGTAMCEINLYNANEEKLTTFNILLAIEKAAVEDSNIISSNYYNVLTEEVAMAVKASQVATHPPNIQDGNWYTWDVATEMYIDTGVAAIGPQGPGFIIFDFYETLSDLEVAVPNPNYGDAYGIGVAEPYDIYIFTKTSGWVDNGPIQGRKGDKGDPGPEGPVGQDGIDGEPGPKGDPGYVKYEAVYNNEIISLTGDESPILLFSAPVDFESGTTFELNGYPIDATQLGGEPLSDGAFLCGDAILVTKGINGLNFKSGGAAELNFDVAVAANAASLPAAASKNRMYIISDIPLPTSGAKFEIGATLPSAPQSTGKVFIQTGQSTTYAFNALKGNNILYTYPTAAYQWDGTTWQARDAYIDRSTTWEQFSFARTYLYNKGNNIAGFVAGAYNSSTGSLTVSFAPTLRATYTGASSGVTSYFTAPFNVTGKNTLSVNVAANTRQTGNGMHFLGLVTTATQNPVSGTGIFTRYIAIPSLQTGQLDMNVSDLSGNYYVYYGQWRSSDATVYQFNIEGDEIWAV